jgi:hypothetical protein
MALAGDHIQVLVGGYELTGDSNKLTLSDSYTTHDVTAFGHGVHNYIPGNRTIVVDHVGYMNSQAAQSHPVLKSGTVQGIVSVLVGLNAAPAVGNPSFSLDTVQGRYGVLPEVNKYVPFMARFANQGDQSGWGVALTPPVSFTSTTTGTGVDNGAATTKGGAAYLHLLLAAATDRYTITVEGATNSGFSVGLTTLATFTLNASALGSERIAIAGTIPQYTRFKATRTTGGTNPVKIAVSLVRF